MNHSISRFALDLEKQDSQVYVTARKGDTARRLSVTLREGGTPYPIAEGAKAALLARKRDGPGLEAACQITEDRLEVTLPAAFTGEAGKLEACFRVEEGGAVLSSPPFTIYVDEPAAEREE